MANENIRAAAAYLRKGIKDKRNEINDHHKAVSIIQHDVQREITRLEQQMRQAEARLVSYPDKGDKIEAQAAMMHHKQEIDQLKSNAEQERHQHDTQIRELENQIAALTQLSGTIDQLA